MPIFFDTEGVGTTGPLVLIQFCLDSPLNGVQVYNVWDNPVSHTLDLIEKFCQREGGIVGFNLVHDWFQLVKWYNILRQVENKNERPIPSEIKGIESKGPQPSDVCLKPVRSCDLMLLARSGKYQYLSKHKPIVIRKVPVPMLDLLIQSLHVSVQMPSGVSRRWRVSEKRNYQRNDVKDIIGDFTGLSTSLKHLYHVITGKEQTGSFSERVGYVPYTDEPDWRPWGGSWVLGLDRLRAIFRTKPEAIQYAVDDVHYTYELWRALGSPPGGDDDSELACLVGAMHWKGFAVAPPETIKALLEQKVKDQKLAPTAPAAIMEYVGGYLNSTEKLLLINSKQQTLEELIRWEDHPVVEPARLVIKAKKAQRRVDLLRKLLRAQRFHFSMKIVGTLTSRMSGGSEASDGKSTKLNAQGIPREKETRSLFLMAFEDEHLEGGDFDAFEAVIADAVYGDPVLHQDILDCIAKYGELKFHAITGAIFYQCSFDDVLKTKGTLNDLYTKAKTAFFAWLYGGLLRKIAAVLDLTEAQTEAAFNRLQKRYAGIKSAREKLSHRFSPLRQDMGPGTKIEWVEPDEYVESILGFRRYFTLEWAVIRGLYDLAESPPPAWNNVPGSCRRTNRIQTMAGATQSALYATIFALQAHVFRAAANHEIQSPGAQITKKLQRRIWDLQPPGVSDWLVRPLNIHDEVLCPCKNTMNMPSNCSRQSQGLVKSRVEETIQEMRAKVPLLSMEWKTSLGSWAEK